MHNSDMRSPGEPDNDLTADDVQVELCFKQSLKWEKADVIAAKKWWGVASKYRNMAALARRVNYGRTKLENRLDWVRDQVVENCVKNINIYP